MQLWAIVAPNGEYVLRFTASIDEHPAECGHGEECAGNHVWPLSREPLREFGEGVSPETGSFTFTLDRVIEPIVARIKAAAAARIECISPVWRQINDARDPTPEGEVRFATIDAVRAWSNAMEIDARACTSAQQLRALIEYVETPNTEVN